MIKSNVFDINRLRLLLIRQLTMHFKTLLIASGAIIGMLIFIGSMMIFSGHPTIIAHSLTGLLMPFFFIGGYLLSSVMFSELNTPHKGYLYLTLPATAFEKLISAWLISSLLYVLFGMLVMWGINLYMILFASIVTGYEVEMITLFSLENIKIFGIYVVTQSVFFLGALYFRKVHFLKTILSLLLIVFGVAIYSVIVTKLLLGDSIHNMSTSIHNTFDFNDYSAFSAIPKYLFWFALAPFMLTVSYFRLKEREV